MQTQAITSFCKTFAGLQDLIDEESTFENEYLEFPVLNLDTVIASNKEIHHEIDASWEYQSKSKGPEIYKQADDEFIKFKKSAQKEVNYLVKEFECKKAADSYARASTARTGVLDMSSLHTYKFNEDIFKKVTVVPEGKNHGLAQVSVKSQSHLADTKPLDSEAETHENKRFTADQAYLSIVQTVLRQLSGSG